MFEDVEGLNMFQTVEDEEGKTESAYYNCTDGEYILRRITTITKTTVEL
jgi:hypothetical protein